MNFRVESHSYENALSRIRPNVCRRVDKRWVHTNVHAYGARRDTFEERDASVRETSSYWGVLDTLVCVTPDTFIFSLAKRSR